MEKVATGEQERVVKLRVAFLCSLRSRSGCSNLGTLAGILTGKSAVNSKKGRQDPHDLASGKRVYLELSTGYIECLFCLLFGGQD